MQALTVGYTAVLLLCIAAVNADANDAVDPSSRPLMLFSRTLSGPLVHGRNVTVRYDIRNVGASGASKVYLRDNTFPQSRFDLLSGSFRHTWPTVDAGAAVTLDVLVTPRRAGILFVAPPAITYADHSGQSRVTRLAAPESIQVEDLLNYRRRTDRHGLEWALYAASFLLFSAFPALFYSVSAPRADTTAPSKKH